MPSYDYDCQNDDCGWIGDRFTTYETRDAQVCPMCGQPLKRVWAKAPGLADMPTRMRPTGGLGVQTREERIAYERANPDVEVLSTTDSAWRKRKDRARERAERNAKKWGFRDLEHFQTKSRAERANGRSAFTERTEK